MPKKLHAFGSEGGAVFVESGDFVESAAIQLTRVEFRAYEKAKLIMNPLNGGNWIKAKKILEDAGFYCYWE